MIRRNKDNYYQVVCSNCKITHTCASAEEASALNFAEGNGGFAVIGKFHFCPSCFSDMLERWKFNNKESLSEVNGTVDNPTKEFDFDLHKIEIDREVVYEGQMDQEILSLCDALNCIPGVRTYDSCFGHGKTEPSVKFACYDPKSYEFIIESFRFLKGWSLQTIAVNNYLLSGIVGYKQRDCDLLANVIRNGLRSQCYGNS